MTNIILQCGCEMDTTTNWQDHLYEWKRENHDETQKKALIVDGIVY